MIRVDDLFFKNILHGISLEIPDTGVTGLVGPNGSGKTTLLRCIFGALRPTRGQVLLGQRPLSRMRPRQVAQHLAVVSQDHGSPAQMTVAELVRLGQLPGRRSDEKAIVDALSAVGMLDKATRSLTELSGGERQRAMIARAFVQRPQHLLLDEPTNHLDIRYQLEVFHQIVEYPTNATVVLHDLNMALHHCDHVHLLNEGRLVASGPPETVLTPDVLEPIYQVKVQRTSHHLHFERNPS